MAVAEAAGAVAAVEDADEATGTAAEASPAVPGESPVLVDARAQALLIGGLRLALAVVALALARARGLEGSTAGMLFLFGCGGFLLTLVAGSGSRRVEQRISAAKGAPPDDAVVEPLWRSLLEATYPSTIGLTIVTAISLVLNESLAAVLAGILAGLGVTAFLAAGRLVIRERELHARVLAERGRAGRVFLRPG
jgi:hypothetical protein